MLKISFDFDEITHKVSNLKVIPSDGKITRNRKTKTDTDKPTVEVLENKLILSDKAIELLNICAGDRIMINYYNVDKTKTIPLIGKSSVFADELSGNKLTKSNTISFKGVQKSVLLEYGSNFILKEFPTINGTYELISNAEMSNKDEIIIDENELPF